MKLEDIRKLCDTASPGPWSVRYWTGPFCTSQAVQIQGSEVPLWGPYQYLWPDKVEQANRDSEFIAAARTLLPQLLAVAERATDLLELVDTERELRVLGDYIPAEDPRAALKDLTGTP